MEPGPYQQVPLTEDEKEFLLSLFDKRRRFMFMIYVFLLALGFMMSRDGLDNHSRRWEDSANPDSKYVSRSLMLSINFLWLDGMIACTGLFFYFKSIRPLKKDAVTGMKEKIPFRIIRKEYDLLGDYYVALDDAVYLHQLLDEDSYYNCSVGDCVYVYRAPKSKFIFEPNGRYDLF